MDYQVITACNGQEAIEIVMLANPDMILMDVSMPVLNGFEATKILKNNEETRHIPIVLITALDSTQDRRLGIELGANDFLTKPVDSKELALRVKNSLEYKKYQDFLRNQNIILEKKVEEKTKYLSDTLEKMQQLNHELKLNHIDTIYRLTKASEYKDNETGQHIKRISLYTIEISMELGLTEDFIERIYYASPMHDMGKVGIPDSILLKSGPLTAEEWQVMKTHTTLGNSILSHSQSKIIQMAQEIAQCHHERWDGKGYPNGVAGSKIPLSARITNIVDQYDALRSKRPYKKDFSHEETVRIITKGDGRTEPSHFDPDVLRAFKQCAPKLEEIFNKLQDVEVSVETISPSTLSRFSTTFF